MSTSNNLLPNIIFLDMDGVLVTPRASLAAGEVVEKCSAFDPVACSLVKRLCERHNAKLVISSAWRHVYRSREAMEAILNAACSGLGDLIWQHNSDWCTPIHVWTEEYNNTSDRGREIHSWVMGSNETKFNRFVILDDMFDMRPLQDSLVQCNYYNGFGWFEYQKASDILNGCDDL